MKGVYEFTLYSKKLGEKERKEGKGWYAREPKRSWITLRFKRAGN